MPVHVKLLLYMGKQCQNMSGQLSAWFDILSGVKLVVFPSLQAQVYKGRERAEGQVQEPRPTPGHGGVREVHGLSEK